MEDCWSKQKYLDMAIWTPTYGQAKAGRPAQTYIQQLCEDTRCNPEDLPKAINDREKWREMVKDIRAGGTTWWWWLSIFISDWSIKCICSNVIIWTFSQETSKARHFPSIFSLALLPLYIEFRNIHYQSKVFGDPQKIVFLSLKSVICNEKN